VSDLGRPGRRRDYRCAVLGLGALGSAAAYWLARRLEDDVVGLEQFEMGHTKGASEDHSRIIRRSYHTPWYVALTAAAYEAWAEVERRAGEQLVLRTGGLDLWPRDAAIPMRDYVESMRACEVPFEELEAGEVARRWPQWNLSDDVRALYQPDAGLCAASRCNAAHRRLAKEEGAELRDRSAVTAIRHAGGEVEIESATGRIRCETLVVAADSWTNQVLAMLGERPLPLTVTKEQVVYFATPDPDLFSPERFPIWIWMDDPCFYGFPVFGEQGPKAGQDAGGLEVDPDTRTFDPDGAALQRTMDFLRRCIPHALGPIIYTKTCLYTLTPDRDFVIDYVPGCPEAVVGIGGGHGYKFASAIGRILAELALDGRTERNIQPFRIDRPILQLENPPANYLV